MNTSLCHLLISFFIVSCNPFEYAFRGEKRGPENFTDFGKALRASYLFSVLALGYTFSANLDENSIKIK